MSSALNGNFANTSGAEQNVPTTANADLRSRVVEILAATANGCLTELGYYPGMPQRMLELEQLNAQWQTENVKLFQDNQKLSRLLRESERSMLINGSDDQRIKFIQALEDQIRGLKEERVNLMKQNEAYHRIYSDYVKLSGLYGAAVHEIDHLRKYIQKIASSQQHPHATSRQVTNGQTVSVPSQISQLYRSSPSQAQPGQWPLQTVPPQNILVTTPFNGLPTENVMGEQFKTEISAQAVASTSQRGTPETMGQTSVDQNQLVPRLRQAMLTNSLDQTSQQYNSMLMHSQTPANGPANPYPRPSSQRPLQPPLTVNTTLEIRSQLPTPSSSVTTLPHHVPFSSSTGSTPLPPTPPIIAFLETCSSPQEQLAEDPSSHSSFPDQSHSATSVNVSMDVGDNPADLIKQVFADQPSNTDAASSPASPPRPDVLKRVSVDISDNLSDDEAQHRKKPRLDDQDHDFERVEGQAAVSSMEVDGTSNREEDDESDDGVIEIGPDGLRLEDDCLATLIEEVGNNEDLKACKLCNARFEMGYATERPQPFVKATKEELLLHCSTEHHDAWEELRHLV